MSRVLFGLVGLFVLLCLAVCEWQRTPFGNAQDLPVELPAVSVDQQASAPLPQVLEVLPEVKAAAPQPIVASRVRTDEIKQEEFPRFDILQDEAFQKSRTEALVEQVPNTLRMPPARSPALSKIFRELSSRRESLPNQTPTTVTEATQAQPVAVPSASATSADQIAWPPTPKLEKDLKALSHPLCQHWAQRVQGDIDALRTNGNLTDRTTTRVLKDIDELVSESQRIAERLGSSPDRANLLSVAYALRRRLDLWKAASMAAATKVHDRAERIATSIDRRKMLRQIQTVRRTLNKTPHASAWYEYLMLNRLQQVASSPAVHELAGRLNVATAVLKRCNAGDVNEKQRQFLGSKPILELDAELRRWVTRPMDVFELMLAVEKFEASPYDRNSQAMIDFWDALRWSSVPEYVELAAVIDDHYRSANVRLSVTEHFINRMIPAMRNVKSPVRDYILGAQVHGQSNSNMRMNVDFQNDEDQIRMLLRARGQLAANTQSTKGAVVLYNKNRSDFSIEKLFVVGNDGVRSTKARAAASGDSSIVGLQTRYDTFPLVGALVRRVAKQRAFESRSLYRRIFENRVATKAKVQVDTQVNRQLASTQATLEDKLLTPLQEMGLDPKTVDMSTSNQRAFYQGRLAGDHQLAAFTARPLTTSQNVVNLQLHSSAINNFLKQMNLEGMEGTVLEVSQAIVDQLGFENVKMPEEIPEDVEIRLASRDAIRVDCQDGKVIVTMRISQLKGPHQSWRNFVVRAHYAPQADGFKCDLMRDGPIHLCGKRLNFGDQVSLRGIFTKVFSKNRPLPMIHPDLSKDRRLADMRITQFTSEDGWVCVSIGESPQVRQAKAPPRPGHNRR